MTGRPPDDATGAAPDGTTLERERSELLARVAAAMDGPMTVLGLAWLVLIVVELVAEPSRWLTVGTQVIWVLFVVQFLLELVIAPSKATYLRRNWLTVLALLVPALRAVRIVRVVRVFRAARGLRLFRVVSSANRGMRTLSRVMGRRGLGYVLALTLLVNVLGAAGIYALERDVAGSTITGFGTALWWTAMTLTTMGADSFPRTPEGRFLGLLLAVYGFTVFGYVTAALASLFVARDAEAGDGELASGAQVEALRAEVALLARRVEALIDAREKGA
jgi:voltage-gated potassium channel